LNSQLSTICWFNFILYIAVCTCCRKNHAERILATKNLKTTPVDNQPRLL
jgi:hypothetical protein